MSRGASMCGGGGGGTVTVSVTGEAYRGWQTPCVVCVLSLGSWVLTLLCSSSSSSPFPPTTTRENHGWAQDATCHTEKGAVC